MTTLRGDNRRIGIILLCALVVAALACRSNQTAANNSAGNNANAANANSAQANQNAGQDQTSQNQANQNASPADANAGPGDPSSQEFEGTAGVTEKRRQDVGPVVLRAVRLASHPGFDRVVFEFEGGNLPGYKIEYVDRPVRQCGSGDVVRVAGDGWLSVRLTPAQAHTEAGKPTVTERNKRPNLPVLKEMKIICDFEADVEWILGLASPNRYRVLELNGPTRLVVDIKR